MPLPKSTTGFLVGCLSFLVRLHQLRLHPLASDYIDADNMPPNYELRRHRTAAVLKSSSAEGRGPWCFAQWRRVIDWICAEQLSNGRRKLRPLILRSNHLIHSRKIIRVIIAFMFARDMQPILSQLMFLKHLIFKHLPRIHSGSFSVPSPSQQTTAVRGSCFAFALSVVCLRANYQPRVHSRINIQYNNASVNFR